MAENLEQTTTIRVPAEVARAIDQVASRQGVTVADASRMLLEQSAPELSQLVELAIFTAAYAVVVAEELALRGLDPEREKTLISDARRTYRKAAQDRVKFFRKLLGGNHGQKE